MKKLSFFLLILLVSCHDNDASNNNSKNIKSKLKEYSMSDVVIPKEKALFKRDMSPVTGIVVEKRDSITIFKGGFESGKKHGIHRMWSIDETLIYEAKYIHGFRHGVEKSWYSNGQQESETNFDNGLIRNKSIWDIDGQLRERGVYDARGNVKDIEYYDNDGNESDYSTLDVCNYHPDDLEDFFVVEHHRAERKKPSRSKKPSQSKKPTNNSSDPLTDNKPDEAVSNPFGGSGGGQVFGNGNSEDGNGGGGNGGSGGGGFGELVRLNAPVPNQPNTYYSGQVQVLLTVNDKGVVISAKSTNGTTHPDQNVIKLVVDHVKKNVKFKAQPGAPIRTSYYTVHIDAE